MSFKPQLNKKRKLNETSFESKHHEMRPHNLKRRSKTPVHLARGSANCQLALQVQRRELTKKRLQIRSGVNKIGTRENATATYPSKPINYSKCNYIFALSDLLA